MQIMSELPPEVLQKQEEAATAFKNRSGWLHELENAQWQQRGHSRTTAGELHSEPQRVESETPISVLAKGIPQEYFEHIQAEHPTATLARRDGMRMSHQYQAGIAQAPPLSGDAEGAGLLSARLLSPISGAPDLNESDVLSSTIWSTRLKFVEWSSQYTHLNVDGQEVNIWIRDARMKGSGLEILSRLRHCLKSLGLRLENLTINGAPVEKTVTRG